MRGKFVFLREDYIQELLGGALCLMARKLLYSSQASTRRNHKGHVAL
jgi:hypothetical protein